MAPVLGVIITWVGRLKMVKEKAKLTICTSSSTTRMGPTNGLDVLTCQSPEAILPRRHTDTVADLSLPEALKILAERYDVLYANALYCIE